MSILFRSCGLAFAGVLVAMTVQPVAADDTRMSKKYGECMDGSGGITIEMMDCITAETERHDKLLNASYKSLMKELEPERATQLRDAQRAWIKFRDLDCSFRNSGGSLGRIVTAECYMNMTAERAAFLGEVMEGGE